MEKKDDGWHGLGGVGMLFTAGATMAGAVLFGFFSGRYLDQWLGTDPWLTVVMFLLGVAAGLKSMYNMAFPKKGETGDDD